MSSTSRKVIRNRRLMARREAGATLRSIAAEFGISTDVVRYTLRREAHRGELRHRRLRFSWGALMVALRRLTPQEVDEIAASLPDIPAKPAEHERLRPAGPGEPGPEPEFLRGLQLLAELIVERRRQRAAIEQDRDAPTPPARCS